MKKIVITSTAIICLMAIYNILVFTLTKTFNTNFWVGYAFIMLSMIMLLICFNLTYASKNSHKVTGLPLTTLSVYYFLAMIILGSCLMYFNINIIAVILPLSILSLIFMAVFVPAILNFVTNDKLESKENK